MTDPTRIIRINYNRVVSKKGRKDDYNKEDFQTNPI